MNKHIVIAVIATVFLGAAGFAEARNGDRGYRNGHHNGYSSSRHYRYDNRRRSHYYNRGSRHSSYYRRSGHHDHYKGLKIAAGAVVLGSLIHAINSDRRERVVYRTRQTVPANDYWYRLDSEGECVEVRMNQQGREVWTYVNSSYCN